MPKILTAILVLAFCSTALADPVKYVCERPAWDGVNGCGPNNTYETYSMSMNTDDFDNKSPRYTLRTAKGCNADKGRRYKYNYKANGEKITFAFNPNPGSTYLRQRTIKLDLDSMTAILSNVEDSPELSCRIDET
jgi:hypothetical protein